MTDTKFEKLALEAFGLAQRCLVMEDIAIGAPAPKIVGGCPL